VDDKVLEILLQYGLVNPELTLLRHSENRTYKVVDSSNCISSSKITPKNRAFLPIVGMGIFVC
jgi:hypothetical protein